MSEIDDQIRRFASASNIQEMIDAGQVFLKTSTAAKVAKSAEFHAGLKALLEKAREAEGVDKLQAIAFAWRLTSVSAMKAHRRFVIDNFKAPISPPTVLVTELKDPDDRRYVGEALLWVQDDWVGDFLISAIVAEREGKQARSAYCRSLILREVELVGVIKRSTSELKAIEFAQKDQSVGKARQLTNILNSFSETLWEHPDQVDISDGFGKSYAELISVVANAEISDRIVRIELAASAIRFFLILARLDPAVSANANNFVFIQNLRRLFQPADWPDELAKSLSAIAKVAAQQMIFLLRLGRPDNSLRALIVQLKGDIPARAFLKGLAQGSEGLTEEDRYWVEKGQGRRRSATFEAIESSALSQFDVDLAKLFQAVDSLAAVNEVAREAFENEAALLPENSVSKIQKQFEKSVEVIDSASKLFSQRGLSINGRIGEVVPFDPNRHEPDANAIGERSVRTLGKVVERSLDATRSIVILKASVEKP